MRCVKTACCTVKPMDCAHKCTCRRARKNSFVGCSNLRFQRLKEFNLQVQAKPLPVVINTTCVECSLIPGKLYFVLHRVHGCMSACACTIIWTLGYVANKASILSFVWWFRISFEVVLLRETVKETEITDSEEVLKFFFDIISKLHCSPRPDSQTELSNKRQ